MLNTNNHFFINITLYFMRLRIKGIEPLYSTWKEDNLAVSIYPLKIIYYELPKFKHFLNIKEYIFKLNLKQK